MNRNAVFSKTGKGLLEIKNKANRLSKDQYRVLNLVDGKANLVDLADKAKVSEIEARKLLTTLADGGYIKEFANPAGDYAGSTVPPSTSYADDLDFTTILGPSQTAKPGFYQSAALEQRQREEAERKASEAAASRGREEAERRAKEEAENRARAEAAARKVREEAERRAREEFERQERQVDDIRNKAENERKVREEAERRVREAKEAAVRKLEQDKLEAERRAKEEAERRVKIQAEARARVEAEKRAREEAERKAREDEERRRLEEEQRKRREEEERKRREEEERKRREEEERRRREEEERKRREEEERKRREEEERKRRQEEERKRREEEERQRREEEEERRRKEEAALRLQEEQERLKRDLEEKQRREQEELLRRMDEERRRLEDDDYRRQAEEQEREEEERARAEQHRREEEELRRREEEERRRKEEDERRRSEEEKRRREQEERRRKEEAARTPKEEAFPSLDMTELPTISAGFDTDLQALKRVEAEVEQEFRVKEDAIRKALEEQERRFRMEEEARAAMDRAEREARERADREARELALAAERARRDAEHKAREEAGRRAEEERERRSKEKEERRKQGEEDRKKRELQRREAEQRAREEELSRRRKEQQEQDRRKAELDRLQGQARRRAFGPGKMAAVGLLVLALLAVAVVEFAPMSAYAPSIEKAASEAVGEPVRVGGVRASLFPSFHVQLDNVTVGNTQDVRVGKVVAYMSFGSAFGEQKDIGKLVLEDVSVPQDALERTSRWLSAEGKPAKVSVERLVFKAVRVELKGATLPSFDADVLLAPDRSVRAATIETTDGRLTAELTPREQVVDVVARGRNFTSPLGPGLELTDFTAKGQMSGTRLRLTELEYSLYGGQGKGSASVSWGGVWTLEGDFSVQRVELEPAMTALKIDIVSDGTLEAKGRYVLQSAALERLFDGPRVDAVFMVRKGNLSGLDLVRALQSPSRDGTAGGKTKFEELSGSLSTSGGRYLYNGVRLVAGALTATGQGEIAPNQEVNGRTYVELRSSANVIRGNFRVQGNLKGMVLRP